MILTLQRNRRLGFRALVLGEKRSEKDLLNLCKKKCKTEKYLEKQEVFD